MAWRPQFPVGLTPRGRGLLAVGLGLTIAGVLTNLRDLTRVGVLLAALPALAYGLHRAGGRRPPTLTATRRATPERAPAGTTVLVRLGLTASAPVSHVVLGADTVPPELGVEPRFVLDPVGAGWRRSVSYRVSARRRGRYELGPVRLQTPDPFGLLDIEFVLPGTSPITVTPAVVPLPAGRLTGEWEGTGLRRPRALAAEGEEDVTVRSYRRGDDRRRVHWRATARHGELMVRREEQPWQSRATVLLDTRRSAYPGVAGTAGFEWAVSMTASIVMHALDQRYSVLLVTDDDGVSVDAARLDATGGSGDAAAAVLDALAVVERTTTASLGGTGSLRGSGRSSGVLIAILGRVSGADAEELARSAPASASAMAIVVDPLAGAEHAPTLVAAGWRVAVAGPEDSHAAVWESLMAREQ